jgi:hypothetical protein
MVSYWILLGLEFAGMAGEVLMDRLSETDIPSHLNRCLNS